MKKKKISFANSYIFSTKWLEKFCTFFSWLKKYSTKINVYHQNWSVKTNYIYLYLKKKIIFQGITYPSIHAIWARWAPPLERSRLAAVAFSGSYVGTVMALPLSGILAQHFGWEWIFYVFGVLGLLWCISWTWVCMFSIFNFQTANMYFYSK